jgi:hypothetical protein
MNLRRLEEGRKIAVERLKADQLRAEMLAVERLEEDRVNADRIESDELYASLLVADRVDADLLYAKQIAAARLEEDRRLIELAELPVVNKRKSKNNDKRRHNQAAANKGGVDFIETVKKLFAEKFEAREGARVLFRDLRGAVSSMSQVEENLFQRHGGKLFLEQWPDAIVSRVNCERCYGGVAVKQ